MGTKLGMAVSMLTSVVVAMTTMIVNRFLILISLRKDLLGSCSKLNKHIYNCTCIDCGDDGSVDYDDDDSDVILFNIQVRRSKSIKFRINLCLK